VLGNRSLADAGGETESTDQPINIVITNRMIAKQWRRVCLKSIGAPLLTRKTDKALPTLTNTIFNGKQKISR
jgi:hypothetical protein